MLRRAALLPTPLLHPSPARLTPLQAYEEFDEEVQEAEDLEERALAALAAGGAGAGAPAAQERDDEIKPFVHKWVLCGLGWPCCGCKVQRLMGLTSGGSSG